MVAARPSGWILDSGGSDALRLPQGIVRAGAEIICIIRTNAYLCGILIQNISALNFGPSEEVIFRTGFMRFCYSFVTRVTRYCL